MPISVPGTATPGKGPRPADEAIRLVQPATLRGLLPGLIGGFSTACPPGSDAELSRLAGKLAARAFGSHLPPTVILAQHHSAALLDLQADTPHAAGSEAFTADGRSTLAYDGAIANGTRPALLVIKTADCVPVLATDAETGRYAALHAGWRGTAAGILPALLRRWREQGSGLEGVRMVLGPHIGGCCYEVGPECLAAFDPAELDGAVLLHGDRPHLSLAAVLRQQAAACGLAAAQVEVMAQCTRCHGSEGDHPYASYRRARQQGMQKPGTNLALIGVAVGP